MRRFVRHPSSIPIELSLAQAEATPTALRNIGSGGLACLVSKALPVGCSVEVRIPAIWPDYRGRGVVAWNRAVGEAFEVGVQFGARDVFEARMIAQLCQIEQYRRQVLLDQGRALDSEQAAREWIGQHAQEFAAAFPPDAP